METRLVLLAALLGAAFATRQPCAAQAARPPAAPRGADRPGERDAILIVLKARGDLWDAAGRRLPGIAYEGPGNEPVWVLPAELPSPASVDLAGSSLADTALPVLLAFPQLRELRLGQKQATDAGLRNVGQLASLRALRLSELALPEPGLDALRNLTQLAALDLERAKPASFGFLRALGSLERLNLSHTAVSDGDLGPVLTLPKLASLRIEFTRISDDGILKLRGRKGLRELAFRG